MEIEGVELEVLVQGRATESQTFFLEYETGDKRIKVSDLVAGEALLLGREELPVGDIINITVLMGDGHSLFFDEDRFRLPLADASSSEISLEINQELQSGISYDLLLDLDLQKSIIQNSSDPLSFEIHPVFTLINSAGIGELTGTITVNNLYPALFLISEEDSISTHLNSSGNFLFRAPEGDYDFYIDPRDPQFRDTLISVEILARETLNLDRITLSRVEDE